MWVLRVHECTARLGFSSNAFLQMYKHGLNSESQPIQVQSPTKTPFSNMDLVCILKVSHGGTNKVSIKILYITHAHVSKLLEEE
jgi:hypothetical protein